MKVHLNEIYISTLHLLFHISHDIKGTSTSLLAWKNKGEKNFTGLSLSSRPKESDEWHGDNMRQILSADLARTVVSDNLTAPTFVLSQRQQKHNVGPMSCNFSPSSDWPELNFWLEQIQIRCHAIISEEWMKNFNFIILLVSWLHWKLITAIVRKSLTRFYFWTISWFASYRIIKGWPFQKSRNGLSNFPVLVLRSVKKTKQALKCIKCGKCLSLFPCVIYFRKYSGVQKPHCSLDIFLSSPICMPNFYV